MAHEAAFASKFGRSVGVELGRPSVLDQGGEVLTVRDHDDVAAGVLARPQLRQDLAEERGVVVDLVLVADGDRGVVGELLERRIGAVRLVDVQGPVREVDVVPRGRRIEVHRPGRLGAAAAARAPRARREDRGEAQGADGDTAELDHVAARQAPRRQPSREGRGIDALRHRRIVLHSSSSSKERSSCGVTAKVYSGSQDSVTASPWCGASSAPRFWTYTVSTVPSCVATLYCELTPI